MREYALVREIPNLCRNNQMRDIFFHEVGTDDPVAYVRAFLKEKQVEITADSRPDGAVYPHLTQQPAGIPAGCFIYFCLRAAVPIDSANYFVYNCFCRKNFGIFVNLLKIYLFSCYNSIRKADQERTLPWIRSM